MPSSRVTCKLPRRPCTNCKIVSALVSKIASLTNLPAESKTAAEFWFWMSPCLALMPSKLATFAHAIDLVEAIDEVMGEECERHLSSRAICLMDFFGLML